MCKLIKASVSTQDISKKMFFFLNIKGTVTGIFTLWGENELKLNERLFSRTQSTPYKKLRKGDLLVFSKEEQTIVSYGRFFHERKGKLENISLMFSRCSHSHPGDPQPKHT